MQSLTDDHKAVLSALRRSIKQLLRAYIDSNDNNELFDVYADPRVVLAKEVLDEPVSSWFGHEYVLLSNVARAATAFLHSPEKRERLEKAIEELQEHRTL